jgi:adenylate kinase
MQVQLNVVMLGAPGAGRGTQAKRLAERFNLSYLSTGDLLLKEIELKTETGRLAETYLQAGKLVPDEIVIRLIEGHIESNANKNGFIFKGFPRTLVQAYILDGLLRKIGSKVSCILDIQVPPLELVKRLAQRGFPFDNSAEAIVRRIEEHEKYAKAIVDYYSKTGRLHSVDGTGSKEAIYERLAAHVEDAWRKAR